jgi:hypothetical protein
MPLEIKKGDAQIKKGDAHGFHVALSFPLPLFLAFPEVQTLLSGL